MENIVTNSIKALKMVLIKKKKKIFGQKRKPFFEMFCISKD